MEDGHKHAEKTDLPLDEIDGCAAELHDAVAAISAATPRTLRAVARAAELGVFRERGYRSMTDWLSSEFRIGLSTAKEWVFLSRRLRELPAISEAFERGRLTWKQLLPLARFATPQDNRHWAGAAPEMYPAELYRELQRRTRPTLKEERAAHASRYLSLVWDTEHPVLYLEGRLGKEQGSALEEAIRERSREIPLDEGADDPSEARAADALVELATSGGRERAPKRVMVLHVEAATFRGTTRRGDLLHPKTIRRLGCDAEVEWLFEHEARPFRIGRKTPRVRGWLERQVRHRDGGACRFRGCERRNLLLSHHIKHWADGGPTDLENLVTLCRTHHRYVHEDGWRISGDPYGAAVPRPDGTGAGFTGRRLKTLAPGRPRGPERTLNRDGVPENGSSPTTRSSSSTSGRTGSRWCCRSSSPRS